MGRPCCVVANSVFISTFAIAMGCLLIVAPAVPAALVFDAGSIEELVAGVREAAAMPVMAPWARVFGAQAICVGALYILDLGFAPPSRSFSKGSAMMRFVWASMAVAVIVAHGGPWSVLVLILCADALSGAHLLWAVSSWKRTERKPSAKGASLLWSGPYWSGLLHLALTMALGMLLLFDPFVIASLVGIFYAPGGPRHADVQTPASLEGDAVWGRLYAAFSLVVGLFFARHGPSAFVPSVGARIVLVAGAVVATVASLSAAPAAAGGPLAKGDSVWLIAPAISAALPSLASAPLAILEHTIRAGKPDMWAVREAQDAKDAHVD